MGASTYDDIAEWYDGYVDGGPLEDDPFYPSVGRLIGPVDGLHVCELACGQGRVARHLSSLGARVVGIDLSARLLAIARRRGHELTIGPVYVRDDAQGLRGIRSNSFDGVVCHMALMDIPDLAATITAVHRVLRPGGWFVFSILHPCYQTAPSGELRAAEGQMYRTVSGYFVEGFWRSVSRSGPPGKVGSYHRTLATYCNTLIGCRMTLEQLVEPEATPSLGRARPVWREVPAVLAARWRKGGVRGVRVQQTRQRAHDPCLADPYAE